VSGHEEEAARLYQQVLDTSHEPRATSHEPLAETAPEWQSILEEKRTTVPQSWS
jgi:hypothetical protein